MTQSIGPLIKTWRQARQLTQTALYADLLSRRQAIRFEQGASDLKATVLLAVLARLEVSPDALQALLTPGLRRAPSALTRALAKLDLWADWPLTPAELKAVQTFLFTDEVPALATIRQIANLVPRFQTAFVWRSFDQLWAKTQAHQGEPEYLTSALAVCVSALYAALFGHATKQAARFLERQTTLMAAPEFATATALSTRVQGRFLRQVAGALAAGRSAVYTQTQPLIAGLYALDETWLGDGLVDNRRHILTSYGLHPRWSSGELGATARIQTTLAKQGAKFDLPAYLAQLPGLTAALAGRPLSAFKAVIDAGE